MRASHDRPRWSLAAVLVALIASCSSAKSDSGAVEPVDTTASVTARSTTPPSPSTSSVSTDVASTMPARAAQPDCTGGTAILETTVLDSPVVIRESTDGRTFCIEDALYRGSIGNIPAEASGTVAITNAGQYGRGWYQFAVPADFPAVVTVYDENGTQLPAARGRAGDYLVVIDPLVGQPTAEPPPLVPRTLDVRDEAGAAVTQLTFQGFAASESATYEQFMACVRDSGVDMAPPLTPGATVPAREPTPPEALQAAWNACEELMFSYLTATQQGGPEYLQGLRFEMDCLANAGFYPMLNEPPIDQAAFDGADAQCRALGPARTAVVDCLRSNGLEVVIDGVLSVGPYPGETADRAWQACRDTFVIWEMPEPLSVASRMPILDCMATKGWISALLVPPQLASPGSQADLQQCLSGG